MGSQRGRHDLVTNQQQQHKEYIYIIAVSHDCFLTHTQISQETGKVVWYSQFFKNFPQFIVIHTVDSLSFCIMNEAEADVFLEFSCFFYNPKDVGNLTSGSSAFLKSSLNI